MGWRRITAGGPKSPTMSPVLSSTQYVYFRKTSSSNMGAPTCFLPREPSILVAPLYACFTCIYVFRLLPGVFAIRSGFFGEDSLATVLNSKHSKTSFSAQIASFSRHSCSRREARVDNHNYAKSTIIRKIYKQNPNIFALNKTESIYIQ